MRTIHVIFPHPGDWTSFRLVAQWADIEGYTHTRRCVSADIPVEHWPMLQATIESIRALGEPWQAVLVGVSLSPLSPQEEGGEGEDAIELSVHACRADGARRVFSSADYPQLRITDAAAIRLFYLLTGGEE